MIDLVGLPFAEFDQKRALSLSVAGRKVHAGIAKAPPLDAVEVEPKGQIEVALDAHLTARAELQMGSREVVELHQPGGRRVAYDREGMADLDRAISGLQRKIEFGKRRIA